jgi:short-subunit dehydrogenase
VNVKSIYHFTHAFVPQWRTLGRGVMLNVGSTADCGRCLVSPGTTARMAR